ncbi:MAG: alginate lyase family protein [bacterium]
MKFSQEYLDHIKNFPRMDAGALWRYHRWFLKRALPAVFLKRHIEDGDFFRLLDPGNEGLAEVRRYVNRGDCTGAKVALLEYYRNREGPRFFFRGEDREKIVRLYETTLRDERQFILKKAEDVLQHRFDFLGSGPVDFGPKIDWTYDFRFDRRWTPYTYYLGLEFIDQPDGGDINYPCELNKHQFFTSLGIAHWLTGDERYLREFLDLTSHWIESNPYCLGVQWFSALEVAMRCISWIWAWHLFVGSSRGFEGEFIEILKCLFFHGQYINDHLSLSRTPNNHLDGELAGLVYLGVMFPEFKDAKAWRDRGLKLLSEHIRPGVAITEDGLEGEHSFHYHNVVADFLLQVIHLCRINTIPLEDEFVENVRRMVEFTYSVMKPDGGIPMVGDMDSSHTVEFRDAMYNDYYDVVSFGFLLFDIDLPLVEPKPTGRILWFFGEEGIEKIRNRSAGGPKESILLKDSGYFIMRGDDKYILFDCGGFGYAAHAHLDMLNILLYSNGRSLIVDSGTYLYNGAPEYRLFFRGTRAHNTATVDGRDQVEIRATFDAENYSSARCSLLDHSTSEDFDYACAEHTGYAPTIHRRSVLFVKPEYWIVTDLFDSEGDHRYEIYFHFPPGAEWKLGTGAVKVAVGGSGLIVAQTSEGGPMDVSIVRGEENPVQGWVSFSYGYKEPAPVLIASARRCGMAAFNTVLYPYKETSPRISVSEERGYLKITGDGFSDYYLMPGGAGGEMSHPEIATDASLLWVRLDDRGEVASIFLRCGTSLTIGGREVWTSDFPIDELRAKRMGGKLVVSAPPNARLRI